MSITATKRAREAPIRGKAHRKSEASFRSLVETLASPVFFSRGGRFHYVNHAAGDTN